MGERLEPSVVVATHGRARLLERLLAALDRQVGVERFEVVVVDDGSTDRTSEMLAGRNSERFDLVVQRLERNAGPATARNHGWRAARGNVVAFTDDDCVPAPGWLAELLVALADSDVVQGRTIPDPAAKETTFTRTMHVEGPTGMYETCNIAYRREVLDRAGGFDERFRHPYGEDTDLAWRARAAGARAAFAPEALVEHEVWPATLTATLRDIGRREGIVHAVARHPGLRDHIDQRWFYKRSHPYALVAGAGLAGLVADPGQPQRWALAVALGYPYLRFRTRLQPITDRRRRWPLVVPTLLAMDLVEIAVLARASIRYRTLLL